MLSSQIVSSRVIPFFHLEHFGSCFVYRSSGGHHFGIFLRSKFSALFVPISFRCFVQVFLNQSTISSFNCFWIPSIIFVIFLILLGDSSHGSEWKSFN